MTSAELLAIAAFRDGLDAQAFPLFGSERTGAPVMAFCRIDDREIRTREPTVHPDALVIQDPTLLHAIDLSAPLVLVNTSGDVEAPGRVITVPATDLARKHLGRPMPGTALLGALVAATGITSFGAPGGGDPRTLPRCDRRRERCRRARRSRSRRRPCLARSRAGEPSPRRWRAAGPR